MPNLIVQRNCSALHPMGEGEPHAATAWTLPPAADDSDEPPFLGLSVFGPLNQATPMWNGEGDRYLFL